MSGPKKSLTDCEIGTEAGVHEAPSPQPVPAPVPANEDEDPGDDGVEFDGEPEPRPDGYPEGDLRVPALQGELLQRGDHVELAAILLRDLRAIGQTVYADGAIHIYRPERGIFEGQRKDQLSRHVQGYAGIDVYQGNGMPTKPLKVKEPDVRGAVKLANDQITEPEFFAQAPAGIAFSDVFVRVAASGITKHHHSADHRAKHPYPFAFDATSSAPLAVFLEALFRDDVDKHEKIAAFQEHAGASLLGIAPKYQRAIVLQGEGNNGKSALLTLANAAMPPGSTCSIPPQEWAQEYRRAMLAGRRYNFVSELPEAEIIASEAFKAIISGDQTTGRHIRDTPFSFHPVAGHVFAANRLPGTSDQTWGFWRRVLVLTFCRDFTNDPMRDPHAAEKIIAAELPRVVSWMLQGAVRLIEQKDYTIPPSHDAALKAWRRQADQVAAWVDENVTQSPIGQGTMGRDVYAAFRAWALENGHRPPASNVFGERMRKLGMGSVHVEAGSVYTITIHGHRNLCQPRAGC